MGWNQGNGYPQQGSGYTNNRPNYTQPQKPKKHSGCKYKIGKNSQPCVYGWNVSRKGFMSLVSCPAIEKDHSITKSGKKTLLKEGWERWVATVEFQPRDTPFKEKKTMTAFYATGTRKLYIPDLKMVASPPSPNGGYFGQIGSKNTRK